MLIAAAGRAPQPASCNAQGSVQPLYRMSRTVLGSSKLKRGDHRLPLYRGAPRGSQVIRCGLSDPWKTLGVAQTADEKEIKRAHRKLVLRYHPDLSKDDPSAGASFLAIQEAYEIIMGRKRGKELDASPQGNGWDFHDWYWRFSMSKRWGRSKKNAHAGASANPFTADVLPPGAQRTQLKSQLDGLKRKAAAKSMQQRHSVRSTAAWPPPGFEATGEASAAARSCGPTMQQAQHTTQPRSAVHMQQAQQEEAADASQHAHRAAPADGTLPSGADGEMPRGEWQRAAAAAAATTAAALQEAGAGLTGEQPLRHRSQQPSPQPQHAQQGEESEVLVGLIGQMGQMVGRVHRLREHSEGMLQNHVVRLVRRASQLGQHLQGQLVKLRVMSNARAETLHHAQQAELHVEFEEAVRQWQQRSQAPSMRARPSASCQAAQPGAEGGAAGAEQEGRESQVGGAGAESGGGDSTGYQQRSRKFVNDSPVRERVSSQLAGLRRRASIRQEFEGEQ